ncbi:hypothetical protein GOBAR_AA08023 [Gossypium barbadense]|uniref:RING-type domain-containing protein n=1 Tax=Gossypium barbadense TaxID=3634 RepID=A0A2P5YAQ4_GOSBA|nr:hypothetical protein GOBAR_AA08023 [Gossypium barbadense]
MGLSSLPSPSEGMLCIILVNTALSISVIKGILRSILHVVGIHLSSLSPSPDSIENESFDFQFSTSEFYIEEFRSRTPAIQFDTLCSCKRAENDCPVCLSEFEPKSEINRLSCGHLFHKDSAAAGRRELLLGIRILRSMMSMRKFECTACLWFLMFYLGACFTHLSTSDIHVNTGLLKNYGSSQLALPI